MIARTWLEMGMPITVLIADPAATEADIDAVADWFTAVNARYSPFLASSEVSRLNAGDLNRDTVSAEFAAILARCDEARRQTGGAFDITHHGRIDPSGYVKGWAANQASAILTGRGLDNHVVSAGGDLQAMGVNAEGAPWQVGIRNPFRHDQHVRTLAISDAGVATSGTDVRGNHIYNPRTSEPAETELVSLTVVAPTITEADLMATAAFAMGSDGLAFLAIHAHLDAYAIDRHGIATFTPGFSRHVQS